MTQHKDGGAAFPQLEVAAGERDGHGDAIEAYTVATGGMKLRDYFAAAALTALGNWTPNPSVNDGDDPSRTDPKSVHVRKARWAYAQADAMLKARALASRDDERGE